MLQKVLQTILRRYFGQFLTGLENVELSFWTGKINIQNASFKHQKINELLRLSNIPLSIKYSFLGSLELDIPWKKLNSAPIEIKVDQVYIVFKLEKIGSDEQQYDFSKNAKLILIKNYVSLLMKKAEEIKDGDSQNSFMKKLLVKVLHNLNLEINNIHIRIENDNKVIFKSDINEEFQDCLSQFPQEPDQLQKDIVQFSMGFCIESITASTIDENNQKRFINVQSESVTVRKTINLRQISCYWEEQNLIKLYELSQQHKIQTLHSLILRKDHRLLSIDGEILMEKNHKSFFYYFSTNIYELDVQLNYEQLKQILIVMQQFSNARGQKKMSERKELDYTKQLTMEAQYKELLKALIDANFETVQEQDVRIFQNLNKKVMMKWSREVVIDMIKKTKMDQVLKEKNKKGWLSFLSKKMDLELTQEDYQTIENEILLFNRMVDEGENKKSMGFYLILKKLQIAMDHSNVRQRLYLDSVDIELSLFSRDGKRNVELLIEDCSIIYEDLKGKSRVEIFSKNIEENSNIKFVRLQVQNSSSTQTIIFILEKIRIIHEIQFLGFLSEMIKLQNNEKLETDMLIMTASSKKKEESAQEVTEGSQKIYQYEIVLKRIDILVELDVHQRLYFFMDSINVGKVKNSKNCHLAKIINIGINYVANQIDYQILDSLNIELLLKDNFKKIDSEIPRFKITLNEQQLYSIAKCLKDQYKILKIRKQEVRQGMEQSFMQGNLMIMSFLKEMVVYYGNLTNSRLYFFKRNEINQKVSEEPTLTIEIKDIELTRHNDCSFKLGTVFVECESKEMADKWIYAIQERIFENSSKRKKIEIIEGQGKRGELVYSSSIMIKVAMIEIIYLKSAKERMLEMQLKALGIKMQENHIQFERHVSLDEIKLTNLSLDNTLAEEYRLLLSNKYNFFEDPNDEEQPGNICLLLEGRKKTHPQYTGEIKARMKVNKLFINYNAEFAYQIIYKIVVGNNKAHPFPQEVRNAKIFQILKQILEESNGIDDKYRNAKSFEFSRSLFEVEKYKQMYDCLMLFHIEIEVGEAEIYLVNGRTNHWLNRAEIETIRMQIDKDKDVIFFKAMAANFTLGDITGYPKTLSTPFSQADPFNFVTTNSKRQHEWAIEVNAGIFEPLVFINQERFKNYFSLVLNDLNISYQQQPVMRFVDFLTNSIIIFILEPFSLHKFDSPKRGPFDYRSVNFTEKEVKKILFESIYPFYTFLNIDAFNLQATFNSFPQDQAIPISISHVKLTSLPYINMDRMAIKTQELALMEAKHCSLAEIKSKKLKLFESKILNSQWAARYSIIASNCRSTIIESDFNFEMFFERSLHSDKQILLPFLIVKKDLIMEGKIKHMHVIAPVQIYNLINKCFIFNLTYDDYTDMKFNTNGEFQELMPPSRLEFLLKINELTYSIPEINNTIIIIQNCEYKFVRHPNLNKEMEVNGKSLHILVGKSERNIIHPLSYQVERALEYTILMKPNGEKSMNAFIHEIDVNYDQELFGKLGRYFILNESCYFKQETYGDLPLIKCHVYFLNSYFKVFESKEYAYVLQGNILVNWFRYIVTHPEIYKQNKALYPRDHEHSMYEVAFKDVNFRRYKNNLYSIKSDNFRTLSSPISLKIKLTNIMKISNNYFYNDLKGVYEIQSLCLKLCFHDLDDIQQSLKGKQKEEQPQPAQVQPYLPYSKHSFLIKKMSLKLGLSALPVPLLDLWLQKSSVEIERMGSTNVVKNKMEWGLSCWNMIIGRWEPVVERSKVEVTVRLGAKERYVTVTSLTPLLINFSIESLKIMKLISQDLNQKERIQIAGSKEMMKGTQISPYVINNRTGLIIEVLCKGSAVLELANGQKNHLEFKNSDVNDLKFDTIEYCVKGEELKYEINLNIYSNKSQRIIYNKIEYELLIKVVSSPILKEIIISSPFVLYNHTKYPLVIFIQRQQYQIEPQHKIAIPFIQKMYDFKKMKLVVPQLEGVTQNYEFELRDIKAGYEHYIIYGNQQMFNCVLEIDPENEEMIVISPGFYFKNLLPLDISVELSITKPNKDKYLLNQLLQINQEAMFYSFGSKDDVSIRIKFKGFNYSTFGKLSSQIDEFWIEEINFVDHRGLTTIIKSKLIKQGKIIKVYFYADSVIVNETPYDLYLFNENELFAGQKIRGIDESSTKYVFMSNFKSLKIGLNEEESQLTTYIDKVQIGSEYVEVYHLNCLYQMVMTTSLHCLQLEAKIFTTITKFYPRFIIVNKTTRQILLLQNNTDQKVYLKVSEMKDWFWHHRDDSRELVMTVIDNQELQDAWDFSAPLLLQALEETVIVLRPTTKSANRLLIKIEIFKDSQQSFIVFKELLSKQDSFIHVTNNLKLVNLTIYQECLTHLNQAWISHKHFNCESMREIEFGWDFPAEEHIVIVQVNFVGPLRSKFINDMFKIDLRNVKKEFSYTISCENDSVEIVVEIEVMGLRRNITFLRKDESHLSRLEENLVSEIARNKVGVSLSEVGISIITGKKNRSEILFIYMKEIDIVMMEMQDKRELEFKIKYANIDNNSNHNTVYPVMFTPLKYSKTMNKRRPFFVMLVQQNLKAKKITEINAFRLCMEPTSLKIYDQVLLKIYEMVESFENIEEKKLNVDIDKLFRSYCRNYAWEELELIKEDQPIFFKEIQIGKLLIEISFSIRPKYGSNFIIFTIISSFGSTISNISESQIVLSRYLRKEISLNEVKNQLGEFYRKQFMKEIYKILGAVNIFGNPYVFIRYLAEGAWEIVNQPSQGFIKGPIEGAIGFVKGGIYCTRNVVAGTFNSFEVFSESFSRGLGYLTLDQKFITRREKIKLEKSHHAVEGIRKGVYALYTGVEVAVTGLYRHPTEDYQKSGFFGGVKGALKGVAGLFTKPVSGLFEGISKVSEGIKNTALMFQDGPNSKRYRPPRIFLSSQRYYTDYNYDESRAISILEYLSTKYLNAEIFYISIDKEEDLENAFIATVMTAEFFILLSLREKKILKEIDLDEVVEVEVKDREVTFILSREVYCWSNPKAQDLFNCFKAEYDRS